MIERGITLTIKETTLIKAKFILKPNVFCLKKLKLKFFCLRRSQQVATGLKQRRGRTPDLHGKLKLTQVWLHTSTSLISTTVSFKIVLRLLTFCSDCAQIAQSADILLRSFSDFSRSELRLWCLFVCKIRRAQIMVFVCL